MTNTGSGKRENRSPMLKLKKIALRETLERLMGLTEEIAQEDWQAVPANSS